MVHRIASKKDHTLRGTTSSWIMFLKESTAFYLSVLLAGNLDTCVKRISILMQPSLTRIMDDSCSSLISMFCDGDEELRLVNSHPREEEELLRHVQEIHRPLGWVADLLCVMDNK
ncbi:hypothetical protein SLE2022_049090 [Rubroshorea leprosula]